MTRNTMVDFYNVASEDGDGYLKRKEIGQRSSGKGTVREAYVGAAAARSAGILKAKRKREKK